ncbi:UDP-N-acetylmuramoyl-tripeptide--D-alanyl-D-alanine ligase [Fontisphaera persica]|uniref:UDP-N-acetylmuramoyl-tripeptide--D-alanyl-D- alanine ligase n=1 Tax=Fontisphaera persica TaxID=2974023 RepID=UPI0024C025EC|nr:UDP-N-acetylmuramoyl-tripeptide--D-alanyl-D-alanine ligase [Fontisphaera persica]WCJ58016.1 UDP-N-acetylmuramoyl-tripeptide--D-alanyl-D-alanine ligase [Fontisphaera persica]
MRPAALHELAQACRGDCRGPASLVVERVCTDSRQVRPGDLFVALEGPRFDGHAFLAAALAGGARAVLAARSRQDQVPPDAPAILVDNPRAALADLARRERQTFRGVVVGVAGSHGKTTTKELAAAVLRPARRVLASEASFNNDIGVPLTLLKLEPAHEVAVAELGTNHPGELAPLVRLAAPHYGLLTALGREHLEFFGSLDGVVEEEGWLAELLPPQGRLFTLGDDPLAQRACRRCPAPVTRVGFGSHNDWQAEIRRLDDRGLTFVIRCPLSAYSREFFLPLLGTHQVLNALLALALAAELGVSPDDAARGLAACRPAKMRLELWETGGLRVLDDAYNANADSTCAALNTLASLPCAGRRFAVLGDMAELGAHAEDAHREAGRHAASLPIHTLVAVGAMAGVTAAAARTAGLARAHAFADLASAADFLLSELRPGDLILLKASRAARLEQLGERLRQAFRPTLSNSV